MDPGELKGLPLPLVSVVTIFVAVVGAAAAAFAAAVTAITAAVAAFLAALESGSSPLAEPPAGRLATAFTMLPRRPSPSTIVTLIASFQTAPGASENGSVGGR